MSLVHSSLKEYDAGHGKKISKFDGNKVNFASKILILLVKIF